MSRVQDLSHTGPIGAGDQNLLAWFFSLFDIENSKGNDSQLKLCLVKDVHPTSVFGAFSTIRQSQ